MMVSDNNVNEAKALMQATVREYLWKLELKTKQQKHADSR